MAPLPAQSLPPPFWVQGLVALIRLWAVFGGLLVAGLALITAYGALSQLLFDAPLAAGYELSKYLTGIAIFMFLPYAQLSGANVSVDLFTQKLSAGKKAAMAVVSALLALGFGALLLRQMALGFSDYLRYPEVTPVLQIPLWTTFPPILSSLVLLIAASALSLIEAARGLAGKPPLIDENPEPVGE